VTMGREGVFPPSATQDASDGTRILVTNHPTKKGAGVCACVRVCGCFFIACA